MTRKELDHARHLRQREQRLRKQHEYYLANKEKYTWRHLYEVYYETKTGQTATISYR